MTELLLLAVFASALLACMALGGDLLYALCFGFALFFGYGLRRGHSARSMAGMALGGIRTIRNVLITFLSIGAVTALWRACGTIACIVYYASGLCTPAILLPLTFLLNALVSALTGTSFGTAATMGVITATMCNAAGLPIVLTGGAVLSGAMFGDRCSPMSTSALLVSELTKTDLFDNIRLMVRTSVLPFLLTCVLYALLGIRTGASAGTDEVRGIFVRAFDLSPVTLLPAAAILVLSALRVNVRRSMFISVLCAIPVAALRQHIPLAELLHIAVHGFHPRDAALAAMMGGGGLVSMVRVFCIVLLSSCYAGMFNGTGFLLGIRRQIERLAGCTTPFCAAFVTSVISGMIACNQTLCIMLTHQLCESLTDDASERAITLENTAVLIAPLVPWSIAGAVPLATVGAPLSALAAALYLWLVPLYNLQRSFIRRNRS